LRLFLVHQREWWILIGFAIAVLAKVIVRIGQKSIECRNFMVKPVNGKFSAVCCVAMG